MFKPEDFDDSITDEELETLPFCNPGIKGKKKDQVRVFAATANAIHDERCPVRAEIEQLKAESNRQGADYARLYVEFIRLREALRFYAEPKQYEHDRLVEHAFRARAALEET